MPTETGHIKDPQLNSYKEFGYLVWDQCANNTTDQDLKCRTLIYLKNNSSKYLISDTPVVFDVKEETIDGCLVQFATDVEVDPKRIENHPVIRQLNEKLRDILDPYLDEC